MLVPLLVAMVGLVAASPRHAPACPPAQPRAPALCRGQVISTIHHIYNTLSTIRHIYRVIFNEWKIVDSSESH